MVALFSSHAEGCRSSSTRRCRYSRALSIHDIDATMHKRAAAMCRCEQKEWEGHRRERQVRGDSRRISIFTTRYRILAAESEDRFCCPIMDLRFLVQELMLFRDDRDVFLELRRTIFKEYGAVCMSMAICIFNRNKFFYLFYSREKERKREKISLKGIYI